MAYLFMTNIKEQGRTLETECEGNQISIDKLMSQYFFDCSFLTSNVDINTNGALPCTIKKYAKVKTINLESSEYKYKFLLIKADSPTTKIKNTTLYPIYNMTQPNVNMEIKTKWIIVIPKTFSITETYEAYAISGYQVLNNGYHPDMLIKNEYNDYGPWLERFPCKSLSVESNSGYLDVYMLNLKNL